MDNPSCHNCALRQIYEEREWLHATCPKWRYPYEKSLFYDKPCELYQKEEKNGNTSPDNR